MRKGLCVILCLLAGSLTAVAGQEAYNWYFGDMAGISFNTSVPSALTDGQIFTDEGCASISDANGNLLFYTDGVIVRNRDHDIMPEGQNLGGHNSSTQSALIVKKPGSDSIYYLFTADVNLETEGRIRYSVIDMSLDGGLGDIKPGRKNIALDFSATEKLAAVQHGNKKDIWIICHEWGSDRFFAFPLTASTDLIDAGSAVISRAGSVHEGDKNNKIGYLKASLDGRKLADAVFEDGFVELFDFDNSTGRVSNPVKLDMPDLKAAYGVEFSPDGSKLYVSRRFYEPFYILQFDIGNDIAAKDIPGTMIKVAESDQSFGALQAGPDGKIYTARDQSPYLGVIENPNAPGMDCDYNDKGIYLGGRKSTVGLPNFLPQLLISDLQISGSSPVCEGDSIFLHAGRNNAVRYDWNGPSGFISTEKNPVIPVSILSDAGMYTLSQFYNGRHSFASIKIDVIPLPDAAIKRRDGSYLCSGKDLVLDAYPKGAGYKYEWSTGSTADSIAVNGEGVYRLTVTGPKGCGKTTELEVNFSPDPQPAVILPDGNTVCTDDSIVLQTDTDYPVVNWYDGDGLTAGYGSSIHISRPGEYYYIAENKYGCRGISDTVRIDPGDNVLKPAGNNYINFDITHLTGSYCREFTVYNAGNREADLDLAYTKMNTEFSVPQSGIVDLLEPGDSIKIEVCFRPEKTGIRRDTLIIKDLCSDMKIPLESEVMGNVYTAENICGPDFIINTKALAEKGFLISLPYPNPSDDDVNLEIYTNAEENVIVPECSLYNLSGEMVSSSLPEKTVMGSISVNKIRFDTSRLPGGIYFILIKLYNKIKAYPIIIKNH